MTVETSTSRVQYATNGTTGPWSVPFYFLADADLRVVYADSTGAETELVLTTDYSVTGAADPAGGSVTTVASYASGGTITVVRELEALQPTDYADTDAFPAASLERNLDRLTMLAQQQAEVSARSLVLPVSDESTVTLPSAADRADSLLGFDSDGNVIAVIPTAGDASALAINLASTASASLGSGMVGHKGSLSYAAGTVGGRLREVINAVTDYAVPNNGTDSATSAIETMFTAAAAAGVREIYFPPGQYLLACARTDSDYTCAVVISGLSNCTIRGSEGTIFKQDTSGVGPDEYGMFRIEKCEGLTFRDFEMDGSGIVSNGTGANRSRGFVLSNIDVNNKTTEYTPTNKRITFSNIHAHDIGGFVGTTTRATATSGAPPFHEQIRVVGCKCDDIIGQDHPVGVNYVNGITVEDCRFVNDTSATPMDNMAIDFSADTHQAVARNNYIRGFMFGMKCETHTGGGGGDAVRYSMRVLFENNTLEEIGLTDSLTYLGTATFGMRLSGRDVVARGNTIRARTVGVTTGGLGYGMVVTNATDAESHYLIEGNVITGSDGGINHDAPTDSAEKFTCVIRDNKISDTSSQGIIVSNGATVVDNRIYRSGGPGIELQTPNQTFVHHNLLVDCCDTAVAAPVSATVAVFMNDTGAVGYTEVTDNIVIDTRGGSAAAYGYCLRAFAAYTNPYVFRPGYSSGLATSIAFDKYVSVIGESRQLDATAVIEPRVFYVSNNPQTTSPWSGIAWRVGDRAYLQGQTAGQNDGWLCTVAGTPGTWVPFGVSQLANAYTVTNPSTDRALNVSADTTAQVAAVLGTLIADLQAASVLK